MTTQPPSDTTTHTCCPFEVRAEDLRDEFPELTEAEAVARLVNDLSHPAANNASWERGVTLATLRHEILADRQAVANWANQEEQWQKEQRAHTTWQTRKKWTLGVWGLFAREPSRRIRPEAPTLKLRLRAPYPAPDQVMLAYIRLEQRGYVTLVRGPNGTVTATPKLSNALRCTIPLGEIILHKADAIVVFGEELPQAA